MGKITVSYPFMLLAAALVALDSDGLLLTVGGAILLHEAGHLLAIRLAGCRAGRLHLGLMGLRIEYTGDRQTSYLQDVAMALAGPAANLAAAGLLAAAARILKAEGLYTAIGVHTVLGLFSLLPALPMDGGRAALGLLSHALGEHRGAVAVQGLTGVAGALMTAAGLWALLRSGGASFVPLITGLAVLAGSWGRPRKAPKIRRTEK